MSSPESRKRKHSSDDESQVKEENEVKTEMDDPLADLQPGPSSGKRVTFEDQLSKESGDQDDDEAVKKLILEGKPESDSKEAKSKEQLEEEERQKMLVLVSNFTEDQLDRYEIFRRAAFPKAAIKRIVQSITGCTVGHNVVIAMAGIAKVFAGEVIENALDYKDELEDEGPIKPKHIREAARRLRTKGHIVPRTKKKRFF